MEKQLMLIVDDIEMNRQLLAEYFEKDYTIVCACDGQDAVCKIETYAQHIAMILLDIVMPGMDGIAVLQWMADKPYHSIPVIAITADARYQLQALRNGAWDFITKPTDNEVIRARVNNVLSRSALSGERARSDLLFKEKQEMDHIINSIPGGIATYRLIGDRFQALYFSDGVAQLSGHSREEYFERTREDATVMIYAQDKERLLHAAGQALKSGQALDETYRIYHKNGSLVWVRMTGILLGAEQGAPIIHAVFQHAPRMVQLYGNLVNESKNLIYVSDIRTYDLLYINHTGLKAMSRKEADYSSQKCYEFLFGRTTPCPFCKIAQMNADAYLEREFCFPTTGKTYFMRGKLTDWNGIPAHVEYAQDITEQKKAEQKSADLLRQLQCMMENIPGGMCVYRVDASGISPLVHNQAFFDIFGYSEEHRRSVTEHTRFLGVHPDDLAGLQQAVANAIRTNTALDITYRLFHDLKQTYIWVNMKAVVVPQENLEKLCYASYHDVTAERQVQQQLICTQQALQDNQIRYETAIKSSGINIWEYDIQKDSLYVVSNSSRIKQNCYRIDNYIQSTLEHGYVREDSVSRFLQIFERLRQGEAFLTEDIWYKTTDEAGWWCERVTYTCVFDEAGTPIKAYGAGRDVTAEKVAEQKFHEELAYRKAMQHENTTSVMIDLTENLVVEVESPFAAVCSQLHTTADAYFSTTAGKITGAENKAGYRKLFRRIELLRNFNRGEFSQTIEVTRLYDSNKVYWIRYSVHLIQNPETKHIMAHVTSTDITHEKVMQTIMETIVTTDYDRFTLVDGSSDSALDYGVAQTNHLFDENRSFEQQNEAWIRAWVCPEDVERVLAACKNDFAWSRVRDGKPYRFSFSLRAADGTVRHKQMQFTKISKPRKTYLVSLTDVNNIYEEQQAARQRLQQALADAEQANRVKTDFLSRMSHDIRTPMNAVLSLAALGQDSTELGETKDYLQKIESAGQYLLAIINDVLNLSKIENRGIVLHPQVVFLPAFIESTVAIVKPAAQESGVELKVTQCSPLPEYLSLDTTYVRQVAVNLLSNAIKFTPRGGSVELILEDLSRGDGFVKKRMTVRDNGIGISPAFLPKLFHPFEQENTQNDLSRQGAGLGLSIVKEIVAQMHGRVWVESEKGRGSCFYVEWTFETASEADFYAQKQSAQSFSRALLQNRKMLLAEDHPLNAKIAVKLLEKMGVCVECVENGRLAVDRFAASACGYYDAVLMDIRMPVMTGLEAARAIRALPRPDAPGVPILAMTANAFDDDVRASLAAGMDAHLAKPIEPEKLYAALCDLLQQKNE